MEQMFGLKPSHLDEAVFPFMIRIVPFIYLMEVFTS